MRYTHVIVALVLAVSPSIVEAGSSNAVTIELAGGALTNYPFFEYVQAIGPDDPVVIAVDPPRFPALAGATVDIYVVASRTEPDWKTDTTLVDVRDQGSDTITFIGATIQSNTFTVAAAGELPSQAAIGMGIGYDIVLQGRLRRSLRAARRRH